MIQVRLLTGRDASALVLLASQPYVRDALLLDDMQITEERIAVAMTIAEPGTTTEAFGILNTKGDLVGVMSLANQHSTHRSATITNLAALRHPGFDVGMKAMEWIVDYAFNVRNLHRLECRVWQGNRITPRLISAFPGAVQEGVLRRSIYRRGEYIDVALYSLLKEEWDAHSASAA